MLDLTSLRSFHALYQHRSLTAAAKAIGLPKSTLSRRLHQLEEEVGQSLATRSGNRLIVTKAGEYFYEYCEKILQIADEGVHAIQSLNNQVAGEITIAANANLIRGWLSPLLDEFLENNPKLTINLVSQYQHTNSATDPDVIFWIGELVDLNWRKEILGAWHCQLFASNDYLTRMPKIEHPRDIVNHHQINSLSLYQDGYTLQHPDFPDHRIEQVNSRLRCDNSILQLDALAKGRGIGLLPVGLYKKYDASHPNQLVACLPGWSVEPQPIYCYIPKGRLPLRVSQFLEQVKRNFPNVEHK